MNGPEYSKIYNKPYCTDELYETLKSLGSNTMTKLHKEEEFSKRHSKRLTERNHIRIKRRIRDYRKQIIRRNI